MESIFHRRWLLKKIVYIKQEVAVTTSGLLEYNFGYAIHSLIRWEEHEKFAVIIGINIQEH